MSYEASETRIITEQCGIITIEQNLKNFDLDAKFIPPKKWPCVHIYLPDAHTGSGLLFQVEKIFMNSSSSLVLKPH